MLGNQSKLEIRTASWTSIPLYLLDRTLEGRVRVPILPYPRKEEEEQIVELPVEQLLEASWNPNQMDRPMQA